MRTGILPESTGGSGLLPGPQQICGIESPHDWLEPVSVSGGAEEQASGPYPPPGLDTAFKIQQRVSVMSEKRKQVAIDADWYPALAWWAERMGVSHQELLDTAIEFWVSVEEPETILEGIEALRAASETHLREVRNHPWDFLESAHGTSMVGVPAYPGEQSLPPRSHSAESYQRASLSVSVHKTLKKEAEDRGRTLKYCATQAVVLFSAVSHWLYANEAIVRVEGALLMLEGFPLLNEEGSNEDRENGD